MTLLNVLVVGLYSLPYPVYTEVVMAKALLETVIVTELVVATGALTPFFIRLAVMVAVPAARPLTVLVSVVVVPAIDTIAPFWLTVQLI
ncbi:MAG: hypothetical protein K2O45_18710 [Oscillospiraceae bacterium]|nr:hypothetical protein [Oscillospiraceae bacterium]